MSEIGLVGLAVMGQNFALNIAEKGFPISVWNRSPAKMHATVARAKEEGDLPLSGFEDLAETIKGGTIANTCATFKADVGIRDGKIAALGTDLGDAKQTIDATGKRPHGVDDRSASWSSPTRSADSSVKRKRIPIRSDSSLTKSRVVKSAGKKP